jgi:hypothetical protein
MNINSHIPPRTVAELVLIMTTQDIDSGPLPDRDPDTGKRVSMARRETPKV